MAGFVAQNVLAGTLRLWYPRDLGAVREGAPVLDVRTRAQFRDGHLPGALDVRTKTFGVLPHWSPAR